MYLISHVALKVAQNSPFLRFFSCTKIFVYEMCVSSCVSTVSCGHRDRPQPKTNDLEERVEKNLEIATNSLVWRPPRIQQLNSRPRGKTIERLHERLEIKGKVKVG